MHRFWLRFDLRGREDYPSGVQMGCGVTAVSLEDALTIVQQKLFAGSSLPDLIEVTPDVDVSSLDERHILPSIGNVLRRGIWFPLGYELTQ